MRSTISRRTTLLSGAAAISALAAPVVHAAGCSGGDVFRIRRRTDFSSFDPIDTGGEDEVITRNVLAPMTRLVRNAASEGGWNVLPHLASRWEVGDDGREITLDLRSQSWSDDSEITVSDVVSSFNRVAAIGRDDKPQNAYYWKNVRDVREEDLRIVIHLTEPDTGFLRSVLPLGAGCVAAGSVTSNFQSTSFRLDPGKTSGRYKICELRPGDFIALEADETWSGDPLSIERAQFVIVPEDHVAETMVATGKLHAMRASPDVLFNRSELSQIVEEGRDIRFVDTPASLVRYVAISPTRIPSPELRRAIQLGIDPKGILDTVYAGVSRQETFVLAASSFLPQHVFGAAQEVALLPDFSEARDLVREVGAEGQRILIAVRPIAEEIEIGRLVASSLREITLDAQLVQPELGEFWDSAFGGDTFDLAIIPVSSASLSPEQAAARFASDGPSFGFKSPEYDATLSELRFTNDTEKRRSLLSDLRRIVLNDGAYLPLQDVQERWIVNAVQPSFMPDGQVGDLGDWARDA